MVESPWSVVFWGATIGWIVGLVAMLFSRAKRQLGLAMVVCGLFIAFIATNVGRAQRDEQAQRLGFVSGEELSRAQTHGITDPEAWKIKAAALELQGARDGGFATVAEMRQAESAGYKTKSAWVQAKAEEAFFRVPDEQNAFVAAATAATTNYRSAPNDLAKGGVRAQRRADMCRTIRGRAVTGWVGKITELTSNTDGKGVITITLASGIAVKTWNNSFSDLAHKTLIEPGTGMFNTLAALKKGQKVKFSGQFFESDVDCVFESSLTLHGAMTSPEFVMRFRSIQTP